MQLADARGVAHFAERLGLDLPDALARDAELLADFFERARVAVAEAEAQFQNFPLAFVQAAKHIAQFVLEQAEARHVERAFGGLVLDEIAEVRVLAVADGRLQRDGLLRHFQNGAHAVHGHLHFVGDFLRRRFAAKILQQPFLRRASIC